MKPQLLETCFDDADEVEIDDSSFIRNIAFKDGKLTVTLNERGTYVYFNVERETYEDFANADSKGKFYTEEIVGRYRYEKAV